jgi:3-isopropylmalate dehydrogenase
MPDSNSRPDSPPRRTPRWTDCIFDSSISASTSHGPFLIGVLPGEGIGPEVIRTALQALNALEQTSHRRFEIRFGGPIGLEAEARHGVSLCEEVVAFCREIFAEGGAILAGPGGGRFVYDLRRQFDLFCKLVPLRPADELVDAGRLKPEHVRGVDILVVRENGSGLYQGHWYESDAAGEGKKVEHRFHYTEREVRRIVDVGARIAACRRGRMTVVVKDGGVPGITRLWRHAGAEAAGRAGVQGSFLNVDYEAYRLIQHPQAIDVIVAPNLFGDILADAGAVLLGSRGLSFSGNFSSEGAAVYQTNHGAAYDLTGTDRANPAGQILSLAMLLRESFGLLSEAELLESALAAVWRDGWRTEDLTERGCRLAGTRQMGDLVARAVLDQSPTVIVK